MGGTAVDSSLDGIAFLVDSPGNNIERDDVLGAIRCNTLQAIIMKLVHVCMFVHVIQYSKVYSHALHSAPTRARNNRFAGVVLPYPLHFFLLLKCFPS